MRAPARAISASAMDDDSPAPASTSTSTPAWTSSRTPSGVIATRFSLFLTSVGTPTTSGCAVARVVVLTGPAWHPAATRPSRSVPEVQGEGQDAGLEDGRVPLHLVLGEVAGDADLVPLELGLLDDRGHLHLRVEHDRQLHQRAGRIGVVAGGGHLVERID